MAISLEDFRQMVGMAFANTHQHPHDAECFDCSVYLAGVVEMFKVTIQDTYTMGLKDGATIERDGTEGIMSVMSKFLDAMPTAEDPHDPTP